MKYLIALALGLSSVVANANMNTPCDSMVQAQARSMTAINFAVRPASVLLVNVNKLPGKSFNYSVQTIGRGIPVEVKLLAHPNANGGCTVTKMAVGTAG